MEFLKKTVIAISAILFLTFSLKAQNADDVQMAFKNSYANEYKANYTAAIADMQKVYKADSYEINLRLGWLQYLA